MKTIVSYNRVSSKKQGSSGLSLEAQAESIRRRAELEGATIIAEFVEVDSGGNRNRAKLSEAINLARANNSVLMIASLDRLARSISFLFELKDSGLNFVVLDMPELTTTTLGISATFAQAQREYIADKTRIALTKKREIVGEWRTGKRRCGELALSEGVRALGVEAIKSKAANNENNQRSRAMMEMMRDTGELQQLTLSAIAEKLNRCGFRTSRGKLFSAQYVHQLRSSVLSS
jgi:DNA invertase Pin-like site-specific DNA recombinase